jgi:hypothetical protein
MPYQSCALTFNIELLQQPTGALHPINPDNASTPCITAAAGTELAGSYSRSTFKIIRPEKKFTTQRPSYSTRYCFVKLSLIAKNSPLLPPVGV